ncbi:MAG: hypothetical protein K2L73_05530 [Muribaculaceae bacterium]|nr:hypothetical protein [Muribaculaceae bacterium]
MKKVFAKLFGLALIVSLSVLSSCGGAPSNEEVKAITEKHISTVTDSEYGKLIDYVGAAINDALPVVKKINEAKEAGDYDNLEKLYNERKEIQEKYPYMSEAMSIVNRAVNLDEISSSNMKKIEKISEKVMDAGVKFRDF